MAPMMLARLLAVVYAEFFLAVLVVAYVPASIAIANANHRKGRRPVSGYTVAFCVAGWIATTTFCLVQFQDAWIPGIGMFFCVVSAVVQYVRGRQLASGSPATSG